MRTGTPRRLSNRSAAIAAIGACDGDQTERAVKKFQAKCRRRQRLGTCTIPPITQGSSRRSTPRASLSPSEAQSEPSAHQPNRILAHDADPFKKQIGIVLSRLENQ
jgi:hypothetical protein